MKFDILETTSSPVYGGDGQEPHVIGAALKGKNEKPVKRIIPKVAPKTEEDEESKQS